jgi:hypothetical protein
MLARLESALASNDPKTVQDAVFSLGDDLSSGQLLEDEVAFEVLILLKRPEMKASPLAAHLLNYFEFEASRISQRAKDRCAAFLREWGDTFTHFHSQQVVTELRSGPYLKPEPLKEPRKKPRYPRA